jgi:hypothetical protein
MKNFALATALALTTVIAAPPAIQPAAAQGQGPGQGQTPAVAIPIDVPGFVGTFTLNRFAVIDGVVNAVGTLAGTVTTAAGTSAIVRTLSIPLLPGATQAACDILHLELGPLDLDLLGLVVHLDKIVLDIDAQPGPGNLLGNLLCSVAGLLDDPNGLARVLNQILSILG